MTMYGVRWRVTGELLRSEYALSNPDEFGYQPVVFTAGGESWTEGSLYLSLTRNDPDMVVKGGRGSEGCPLLSNAIRHDEVEVVEVTLSF
jgi:hypothetical protein